MEDLAQQIVPHPAVIVVLTPFMVIFVWAAWVEVRRWWRYGPSRNKRASFPMDETAPGYESPADAEAGSAKKTGTGQAND